MQRLRDGKLDAALLALPLHDEQLHAQFLFEEPFLFAAPSTHPLAKQPSMAMDALGHETLLLLEDGHCLRDQALDVCRLSGAQEKSGFRATSLETLRQMVAAGVGVTLLPALSVQAPIAASPNIQLIPFRAPVPSRKIALVWRKSSALDDFLQTLGDAIGKLAQAQLAHP